MLPVEDGPCDFPGVLLHEEGVPGLLVYEVVDLAVGPGQTDPMGGVDLVPREVAQVELKRHGWTEGWVRHR